MGGVTLAFIRHGQTDWNRDLRMQGSTDIPLNDTGRGQAAEAVALLDRTVWHAVVSSPLSRARETAQIIAGGLGIELGPVYPDLIERHYGDAEGRTPDERAVLWPGAQSFPGMESLGSLTARGLSAVESISEDFGDANVLIVCHGSLIHYTLEALAGRKFDIIRNASVSAFEKDGSGWRVLTVNDEAVEQLPAA
jgi:probable phosphoglycerate mutase